jgi:hypothetical protein
MRSARRCRGRSHRLHERIVVASHWRRSRCADRRLRLKGEPTLIAYLSPMVTDGRDSGPLWLLEYSGRKQDLVAIAIMPTTAGESIHAP